MSHLDPETKDALDVLEKSLKEFHVDLVCAGNIYSKATRSGPVDAGVYLEIVNEFETAIAKSHAALDAPRPTSLRTMFGMINVSHARSQNVRMTNCYMEFLRNSYPVNGREHTDHVAELMNAKLNLLKESRVAHANSIVSSEVGDIDNQEKPDQQADGGLAP